MAGYTGNGSWLTAGIKAGNDYHNALRIEQQQQIENALKGFVKDENGNYTATPLGEARLQSMQLANEKSAYRDGAILDTFKGLDGLQAVNPMKDILTGNTSNGWEAIKSNPTLKNSFEKVGVTEVGRIDLHNDNQLLQDAGVDTSKIDVNNPEAMKAFNSGFVKTRDTEGNWKVTPTQQLAEVTNIHNNVDTRTRDALVERMNMINDVTFGRKLLTDDKKELDSSVTAYSKLKAQVGTLNEQAKLTAVQDVIAKGGTLSDIQEALNPTSDYDKKVLQYKNDKLDADIAELQNPDSKQTVEQQTKLLKLSSLRRKEEEAFYKQQAETKKSQVFKKYEANVDDFKFHKTMSVPLTKEGTIDKEEYKHRREFAEKLQYYKDGKYYRATSAQDKIANKTRDTFSLSNKVEKLANTLEGVDYSQMKRVGAWISQYNPLDEDTHEYDDVQNASQGVKEFVISYAKIISGLTISDKEKANLLATTIGSGLATGSSITRGLHNVSNIFRSSAEDSLNSMREDQPYTVLGIVKNNFEQDSRVPSVRKNKVIFKKAPIDSYIGNKIRVNTGKAPVQVEQTGTLSIDNYIGKRNN